MLSDTEVQFEEPLTGRIHTWSLAHVYREVLAGKLLVVNGTPVDSKDANKDDGPKLITSTDSLPDKFRKEIERKYAYINAAKKQGISRGQKRLIADVISKVAAERNETAPSTSWVCENWRKLDLSSMNPHAMLSKNHLRKRDRKISTTTLELVRKVLRAEYFTRDRYPLSRAVLLVNRQLKTLSNTHAEVSTSTVRRIANEVDKYHRDAARHGVSYARNKWRYSMGGPRASRVLERVEVDHTQLDLVVICDRSGLPMGRPTITIVVDSYSGYVLGFYISFWGTGLGPTLNALKVAISPKQIYTEGVSFLKNPWMGCGIFELAVVDNGLEFHSPQFKMAAWHLNTDIQYCAVRQPWLKPKVERALGVVSQNLPAQGRVHKPENNYLPPDPKRTAAITFSQLCQGLLKLFVDVMPMDVNEYTLAQPFQTFKEGFERLPPPEFSASEQELGLISALTKNLTVGNSGIESAYLKYNSIELQQLRRQIGLTFKTPVKYQPEDLSYVFVQDPRNGKWLRVPSLYPEYTEGLSVIQHRAIRLAKKSELKKKDAILVLEQGKLEMIDMYEGFLKGNLGKKNIKAAQQFGSLTSSQTLLSAGEFKAAASRAPEQLVDAKEGLPIRPEDIPLFSSIQLD
jgi:putative transposase